MNRTTKIALLVCSLVVVGYFGTNIFVATQAEKHAKILVDKINSKQASDAKINYGDISASGFGTTVTLSDIQIGDDQSKSEVEIETIDLSGLSPESEFPKKVVAKNIKMNVEDAGESKTIRIGTFTIDGLPDDKNGNFPAHFSYQIENLEMDLSDYKMPAASGLATTGGIFNIDPGDYGVTNLDGELVMDYDSEQRVIKANLSQGMDDLFHFETQLELHGFEAREGFFHIIGDSVETSINDPAALFVEINDLALAEVQLQFRNKGLMENIWAALAIEKGKEAEQYKQEVLSQLDYTVEAVGWSTIIINEALLEIKKFNENPQNITISIAPDTAMKFTEAASGVLLDLEGFVKKLNIKVKANES